MANVPTWDKLWARAPRTLLAASEEAVGLPCGQMGNSEVGHLNFGAGRIALMDIMRIDASHHGSSGSGADLTITAETPSPVIGTLTNPLGIAFDGDDLWVNYDGIVARLTAADLSGVGTKTVTPSVQIALDVLALPEGIAFDETGGLWMAYSGGKFARLGASQLTASGAAAPQIVITSSDIGSAAWFAIYPAPAFTPLAHALP